MVLSETEENEQNCYIYHFYQLLCVTDICLSDVMTLSVLLDHHITRTRPDPDITTPTDAAAICSHQPAAPPMEVNRDYRATGLHYTDTAVLTLAITAQNCLDYQLSLYFHFLCCYDEAMTTFETNLLCLC